MSRQTISNWECDQALPAVDKAMELAQLYNISLDDLMENEIEIVSNNKTKDLHLLQYLIGKTCTKKGSFIKKETVTKLIDLSCISGFKVEGEL